MFLSKKLAGAPLNCAFMQKNIHSLPGKPGAQQARQNNHTSQRPKADQVIEELRPGQSIELLKELHILTREGKLNQDTRRKLKQVYHLYQFIEPLLNEVLTNNPAATLADHGAGKSYLGFILYDLFFNVAHAGQKTTGHIYGIETRAELVEKSRLLAERLGFKRMSFLNLSVQQATQSCPQALTSLPPCTPATRPLMTPLLLAWQNMQNTWCWCLAAKLRWPVCLKKAKPLI